MEERRDDGKKGTFRKYSRSLQHDTTHTGHGAQTVCGVLYWQGLILKDRKKEKSAHTKSLSTWNICLPQGGDKVYLQRSVKVERQEKQLLLKGNHDQHVL